MPLTATIDCSSSCATPQNLNVTLTLSDGETVAEQLTLSAGGSPIDLTGYSVKMQIAFPTPLLLNTGNGGITLPDPTAGVAQINIADTVSATFPVGSFPYDLWTISPANVAARIIGGLFVVLQSITTVP
jgi:hypothetical protein